MTAAFTVLVNGERTFRITPLESFPVGGDDFVPVDCRDTTTRIESQAIIEAGPAGTREGILAEPQVRDAIRSAYYSATSRESGRFPVGGARLPEDFTVTVTSKREIVQRFPVQPGLWVAVEDSHCLLLQLTTPNGMVERARSGALSNGDDIQRAIELARVWVTGAEIDAAGARMHHVPDMERKRRHPRGGTPVA